MDIIAAIATGGNPTAIGIVRVSGEGCFALCDKVFRALNVFRPRAPEDDLRRHAGRRRPRY